ncbi:restriction endonuclease subunit S [Paraburkholderia sp. A3BS-1L]|uniref:restriction endonuclease subunit S n=1 Tax=Paraburkholderia sp. A3BS-1L TaxID=3028375 RepID=UPI003DA9084E
MSNKDTDAMSKKNDEKPALVPRLRFPDFRDEEGWGSEFGDEVFAQVSNKDHNSDLPVLAITQEHGAIPRNLIDYHVSVADKSIESYKVVEVGDFIISLRSFQGGIEYSKYHGICSPAYVVLRLKRGHSADYFRQLLKTDRFIAQLNKNLEGLRDGKMVSYKQFSELPLPIPSQAEQQKIADCLSSLDELITAEGQKLDTLKAHKKGLMLQIFPREGETVPRLRFKEFLNEGDWERVSLGDLGTLVSGLTYSPDDVRDEGLLVLRSSNIKDGRILLDDCVYVDPEIKGANLTKPDDILICVRNGSSALIGKNAIIPKGMPLCTHGAFMTVFRSECAHFIFQLFQTPAYQNQVAADLGATINSINGGQLLKYKFFVPKQPEQTRIVNLLSSLDELVAAQTRKIDHLKKHKAALMQQLFPAHDEVLV